MIQPFCFNSIATSAHLLQSGQSITLPAVCAGKSDGTARAKLGGRYEVDAVVEKEHIQTHSVPGIKNKQTAATFSKEQQMGGELC